MLSNQLPVPRARMALRFRLLQIGHRIAPDEVQKSANNRCGCEGDDLIFD